MSNDPEFFSFEEALDRLRLKEEELKRLVSEGEIRAFRDGETMRLRRRDVDELRSELMGGDVVDLGSAEDMLFDDDPDFEQPGMATEELSAADTLLDEELEVLELEEDAVLAEDLEDGDEEEYDEAQQDSLAAAQGAGQAHMSPLALVGIFATTMLLILTIPILISLGRGHASDIAKGIGGIFVVFDEEQPTALADNSQIGADSNSEAAGEPVE